jgi:hypothetical protein
MLKVAQAVAFACFSVCWATFMLANLIQIRYQRTQKKQTINYYLSRMNVMLALGMFIDNLATFADYFLVGEAFQAMYMFGTVMRTLMAQVGIGIWSFITYQALLAAYTLDVVASDTTARTLRKRFIAINVSSMMWSLTVVTIMHILNKHWLLGLAKAMWTLVISLLGFYFWSYYLLLIRTARTMAKAVGVKRAQISLRRPMIMTALSCLIVLGLFGSATLDLLDTQAPHHGEYMEESNVPVSEVLLLLACITSTIFAWLPLKKTVKSQQHHRRTHHTHRKSPPWSNPPLRYALQTHTRMEQTHASKSMLHTHTQTFTHMHTYTRTHTYAHTLVTTPLSSMLCH